jgi:hypothetical protein
VSSVALPAIGDLVDVSWGEGSPHPSRVEDRADRRFVIAAPFGLSGPELPDPDTDLELAWLVSGGRLAAPAAFVERRADQLAQWVLTLTGEPQRRNRRAYVRGGGGEQVRLRLVGGDEIAVEGRAVDMGEGSVRCRVERNPFQPHDRVDVTLRLDDETVSLTGSVLSVKFDRVRDHELVVVYALTEPTARSIRRHVMQRQMAERRRIAG